MIRTGVLSRLRRCKACGGSLHDGPPVLHIGDGNAKSFHRADDLAIEIAVAVHLCRRDKELGILPRGSEIPSQLRKGDGPIKGQTFPANCNRIDLQGLGLVQRFSVRRYASSRWIASGMLLNQ